MVQAHQTSTFRSYLGLLFVMLLSSCHQNENSPGVEFMPDMYRSPAVEAYMDYHFRDSLMAMRPPEGTIPFNPEYKGSAYNPNLPYPYPNSTEGYQKAGKELENPIPLNKETLQKGEDIYVTYCDHCHGEKGEGDGPVIESGHAPPPSFTGPLSDLPDGKAFHSITYGKGLMGSHASQLNKKERWLVIHYINDLQNGSKKLLETEKADSTAVKADTIGGGMDTTERAAIDTGKAMKIASKDTATSNGTSGK